MTEAERNMHAGLNAIYLEVPAEIAQDLNEKVRLRVQELEAALRMALPYLDNSDAPGGCDGKHKGCGHCAAIKGARQAVS